MKPLFDLRSDTVTLPTKEMLEAIPLAVLGDDVLEEDRAVKELESTAAELFNKEGALLVPSGTFGNQLALAVHCQRGDEIYLSDFSHIIEHEVGAAPVLAGVQTRTITPKGTYLTWNDIEMKIRKTDDIHYPRPRLIELENALPNGNVMSLKDMDEIWQESKKFDLIIHLDGARIFNAAIALNCHVKDIASKADSIMFCLSKGLCAPVGSLLLGTKDFISKARKIRKLMGGGMRQAGIIAAPGIIAINKMTARLVEDHQNANKLIELLQSYPYFNIPEKELKINMVFVQAKNIEKNESWINNLKKRGIITYPPENNWIRFVFHHGIKSNQMDILLDRMKESINEVF